ncbi:hypothetical protein P4S95_20980 [Aneurinibacillus aneurinilyticus]|uniref:hypothetical protein n=1 Tax=Aneurinibacillus aneurinilyticus TaxID=1391 RepID=UPI002E235155|nr:hypothetical protein [Aneurinibacillus aneurinilyticus]
MKGKYRNMLIIRLFVWRAEEFVSNISFEKETGYIQMARIQAGHKQRNNVKEHFYFTTKAPRKSNIFAYIQNKDLKDA